MRILDTHLHLIYPERFGYPWLGNVPALNRRWSVEDYWAEARPLGIESALHMEVDAAEADMLAESRFAAGLAGVAGVVAAARPEHRDFPDQLQRLAELAALRGVRRVLHVVPDEVSQSDRFVENVQRLANYRLPFDLCVRADQLPLARRLVAQCPDVQFVLDHCGNPRPGIEDPAPWQREIRDLAALPNVVAKISGIIVNGPPDPTAALLRPCVEYVIETFGWDRVVWGSDHPVCTLTSSLTQWVGIIREIVAGASDDEQGRLFHRNAERVYRVQ